MEAIKHTKTCVVGVDISMETTTYAIIDIRGNILVQESFGTLDYPQIDAYVASLCDRITDMVLRNGGYEKVRSVGVCSPSSNFLTGCMENAANMPWKGVIPLAAMMRDRLGLAVAVGNNAHCVGLGEQSFGSARGMKNFLVITLGYGLGSSVFSNGKAHLGCDGFSGEFGHCCIVPDGRQCTCGRKGCLEAYCSTRGILQTARELMEESDKPSRMRLVESLTPKIVASFCELGDELSIETFRRTGEVLGLGLANYASVLNPEAIILTGGIPHAGRWLLEPMEKSFEQHVFPNIRRKTKLLASFLENEMRDVLGASVLAWKVKEYSLFT